MNLSAIDVIIITFFVYFFKWLFRVLALFTVGKLAMALKDQGKKALKDKLRMEDDDPNA